MSESMIRFIENHRASLQVLVIAKMPPVEVPPAIRAEYSSLLELVFRLANYLDNSLPVFSIVSQDEENTKKLLSAIVTVQCQRTLLASPNPIFIVSFETLQKYHNQLQNARRQIYSVNQTTIEGEHPSGPPGDKQPDGHIPPGPSHVLHSFPPSQPLKPPLLNNTNHKGVVSTPKYFAEISPSSWNTAGVKRSREEELGPSAGSSSNLVPPVVNKPSPPKRRRTGNWEVPIGQSLQKNQAVENIKRYIESAGPSTFVDPVMSTTFPLVERSDKNVPVLDAWRSITRDPRYKVLNFFISKSGGCRHSMVNSPILM
ncbi:hypothetical protein BT96DRAFT_854604 [Gymnopus androsaceus JB14]|uniref:Uncharacterized protein n=1 Tax=Gymnopus androsaceus JB14 TaxID=1447944 RepID=A0A6A4I0X0_9AGAR|nr:hypothetical protein BT96DRAFT_854604 [Gymnopus androsaceus JB14]